MTTTQFTYDNSLSADENLSRLYDVQLALFEKYQQPLLEEMEGELSSNDMIQQGKRDADFLGKTIESRTARETSRYASIPTAAQQASIDRNLATTESAGKASTLNAARVADRKYKEALTDSLMQTGSGLVNGTSSGLTSIAAAEQQRDNVYQAQKSQYNSNVMGGIGSVAGGAVGGPAGAAAGAAIGTAIGGML